jgi:hypothetical protein
MPVAGTNFPVTFGIFYGAHVVLPGVFFTATSLLCQRLFPRERFTLFYSATMLVRSLALIAATSGTGK